MPAMTIIVMAIIIGECCCDGKITESISAGRQNDDDDANEFQLANATGYYWLNVLYSSSLQGDLWFSCNRSHALEVIGIKDIDMLWMAAIWFSGLLLDCDSFAILDPRPSFIPSSSPIGQPHFMSLICHQSDGNAQVNSLFHHPQPQSVSKSIEPHRKINTK